MREINLSKESIIKSFKENIKIILILLIVIVFIALLCSYFYAERFPNQTNHSADKIKYVNTTEVKEINHVSKIIMDYAEHLLNLKKQGALKLSEDNVDAINSVIKNINSLGLTDTNNEIGNLINLIEYLNGANDKLEKSPNPLLEEQDKSKDKIYYTKVYKNKLNQSIKVINDLSQQISDEQSVIITIGDGDRIEPYVVWSHSIDSYLNRFFAMFIFIMLFGLAMIGVWICYNTYKYQEKK